MTDALLRWPADMPAICDRIAGTRAELKFVLKTRNERELLERWIQHHLALAGPQGLVIFDNGSADPEVLATYGRYGHFVQIFGWDLNHNRIHNATQLRPLYQALRSSCQHYAFLDTDEFAFWTDGERLLAEGLVARLATHEDGLVYPGMWWEHRRGTSGVYVPKVDLAWGKPLISAAIDLKGRINHNVQLVRGNPGLTLRGGFVVCHHSLDDATRRIRVNVDKCVAYGWVKNREEIDAIIAAGRVEDLQTHFRLWVRQIARLRSEDREPVGPLGPKSLAVEPDGRLRLGSLQLGRALREFAANAMISAEAISSAPTAGPPESVATPPENRQYYREMSAAGMCMNASPETSAPDVQPLERLATEMRRLAARLTAQEWRFDELAATIGSLEARHDQTQAALDELRAAVEPARLAALGGLSADEIAHRGEYLALVARVRRTVRDRLPKEARVLVIGRGDEDLVQLSGRRAAHFPQDAAGDFAGEYPGSGSEAVEQLRGLVTQHWDHLVIPATSFWWLESYPEFRIHLLREWHAVQRDESCLIFAHDPGRPGPWQRLDDVVARLRAEEGRLPAILDWESGCDVAEMYPACAVFTPPVKELDQLPYLERSIDIVAVPWDKPERVAEARRVATAAVVRIAPPGARDVGFFLAVESLAENGGTLPANPGSRLGLVMPNRRT